MTLIRFERRIALRIKDDVYKEIVKICKRYPGVFDNESHFVRAAVIAHLREWKDKKHGMFINSHSKIYK